MSTSREQTRRADDRLVTVISGWLAGHVTEGELRGELESTSRAELEDGARRAELQMVARETLEALALGG